MIQSHYASKVSIAINAQTKTNYHAYIVYKVSGAPFNGWKNIKK